MPSLDGECGTGQHEPGHRKPSVCDAATCYAEDSQLWGNDGCLSTPLRNPSHNRGSVSWGPKCHGQRRRSKACVNCRCRRPVSPRTANPSWCRSKPCCMSVAQDMCCSLPRRFCDIRSLKCTASQVRTRLHSNTIGGWFLLESTSNGPDSLRHRRWGCSQHRFHRLRQGRSKSIDPSIPTSLECRSVLHLSGYL